MPAPPEIAQVLGTVTASLPGGGEERPGQLAMAEAVGRAIDEHRHLVVGAGTGTGKSLAYLVPAVLSGRSVVVATATRALQDQLATKDLPLVADALGSARAVRFAVLKGRSNYLCRQRAAEMGGAEDAGLAAVALFDEGDLGAPETGPGAGAGARSAPETVDLGRLGGQLRRLIAWAETSPTGDRAELDFEPSPRAWAALSVSARECPGAFRCPSGTICFTEQARERAGAADVVVVNTHLYATHVASDGAVLPEHDIVVLDEAHAVEDVMTEALGVEITAGRLRAVAQGARALLGPDAASTADGVVEVADRLDAVLRAQAGRRVLTPGQGDDLTPEDQELAALLELAGGRLQALTGALRRADGRGASGTPPTATPGSASGSGGDEGAQRNRALLAVGHLGEEVGSILAPGDGQVVWVEASGPSGRTATLRAAPIDVGPLLAQRLWPNVTAVLTSATVPPQLETRLGLPAARTDHLDVGSPFPFDRCALLYCAKHLPDPRRPGARQALHEELGTLITAAGGRTLALFTSWRAMHEAADALRPVLPFEVLAQGDKPKAMLLDAFSSDHAACLFATMSFWQGVDVPGPTLSLVALDRLPFSRPDDPLLQARRDRAGDAAFRTVDLPRAATLLAQGTGRLIRSSTDSGVVAVLDSRLATAGYRHVLLEALPPMRRTVDHDEVVDFLRAVARRADSGPGQ
ncbi:MAG TPA: ATP-dependent DNA helicase [Acidimicrobiales bacterium]|nr:ATP-dependent DNA helicase [Acidimicrobiales bacterium]